MVHPVDNAINGHRDWLQRLFKVGVAHCQPRAVLPSVLPKDAPVGRNIVLGAGKSTAEMAAVASEYLVGTTEGLVVTRYGHGVKSATGDIEVLEAGHPVPDEQSTQAATRMLEMAENATVDDRVLFLFSGGGSALLCAPIDGVTFEQKQDVTRFLLHSGAPIEQINRVRKHLSRVKGGGLAAKASRAELRTYVISDIVGNKASDVASGPSIGTTGDVEAAIDILNNYRYPEVLSIADAMRAAPGTNAPEHPVAILATAKTALDAIAKEVAAHGWTPVIMGDDIVGDAAETGRIHAELSKEYQAKGQNIALISGGELTVQVRNKNGRGGPNLEYLTSLMIHLNGAKGIEAIACDSDGIDGSEDDAGGIISWTSLKRAAERHINPAELLANNNSYDCFSVLDDLVVTGPTRTNVNDIRVILIGPSSANENEMEMRNSA